MFVTYKKIGENGRLGNQLFQYAAIKGLASKINFIPVLPFGIQNKYWHGQKCLLHDLFDLNIKIKDINTFDTYNIASSKGINDTEFFNCKANSNINIDGFPESEYYFRHIKDEIKKDFTIKDDIKINAMKFMNDIKNKNNKKIVAIHIRRGDTLDCLDNKYIQNGVANIDHCTDSLWLQNYLTITINKFDKNEYSFLIFSGGSRIHNNISDIEWCEYYFNKHFPDLDINYSKNNTDTDDFIIFTLCDHAILTSLSTFGWWGAYLINNPNKKIYVPEINSNSNNYWNTSGSDFWSDEFRIIQNQY
jgi:hypothetical protein